MNNLRNQSIKSLIKYFKIKSNLIININKRLISTTKSQLSQGIKIKEVLNETIDVEKYRSIHGIQCFGHSIVDPFQSFECYQWHKQLDKRIRELGFENLTPIQAQSLPFILNNRDLIGIARSGSGKTLSFVLPALVNTLKAGLDFWPKCLILTPTRELTHQIEKVVKKFRFARSVCLYGGVSREFQSTLLKRVNPHIIIATPGRLEDILNNNEANLQNVDYVVIDEADRMLAMGFETPFRNVMNLLPKKRQTLMFSATFPESFQSIAEEFLCDYVRVNVSKNTSNESLTVNHNIEQIVKICEESDKENTLIECLNKYVPTVSGYTKTIIFVRKKRTADKLVKLLKKEYLYSRALHSDRPQPERDYIIREFQKGTIPIIIATDVASRGLDFKNVKLVINYDFPSNIEDYIHRIGRTARHLSKGMSYTLFTPQNIKHKTSLIDVLHESEQHIDQQLIDLTLKVDKLEDSGYESSSEYSTDESSDSDEKTDIK